MTVELKSVNLQYDTLGRWVDGPNNSLTKRLMFQVLFSFIISYRLMPYPCSHFYFDIKFGNRLYSKEKRRAWPLLF